MSDQKALTLCGTCSSPYIVAFLSRGATDAEPATDPGGIASNEPSSLTCVPPEVS